MFKHKGSRKFTSGVFAANSSNRLALFTQRRRIISAALVLEFSAIGHSHRAKHPRLEDEPPCNSHRKPALQLLKRRDCTRHDDDPGVLLLI